MPTRSQRLLATACGAALLTLAACKTSNPSRGRVLDAVTPCTGNGCANQDSVPNVLAASALRVMSTYATGGSDWMGIGFGSVWAPAGGQLVRIDPASHQIAAQIPVGSDPYRGVGIGTDAVWIASVGDGAISRIDPATNTVTATFPVSLAGGSEGSIGVGPTGIWLVTDDGGTNAGTLSRMDPTTGQIALDVPVAPDSHGVVVAGSFVWVTSFGRNTVTQVDAASGRVVATLPVDRGPRFITEGFGGVWVLSQGTGSVTHIDASTGQIVAVIAANAAGAGGDIATGEGAVWVSLSGKPVTRIDPATNKVLAQYAGGGFGDAIRAAFGSLWVSGPSIFEIAMP